MKRDNHYMNNINELPTLKIETTKGYIYTMPDIDNQPDIGIVLSYDDIYNILLDGIINESTIEPLTPSTYLCLVTNLIGILIDTDDDDTLDSDMEGIIIRERENTIARILSIEGAYNDIFDMLLSILPVNESHVSIDPKDFTKLAFNMTEQLVKNK